MECEKNKKLMLKYIEGTINGKEMLSLNRHIEMCEECREEFAVFAEISDEINGFNFQENKNEVFSENFEGNVMKKISGVDFKTEKILICIIGIISFVIAFMIFIEVFQNYIFGNDEIIKIAINNSKDVIDKASVFIGVAIGEIFRFLHEFLFAMKPFSFMMILFFIVVKAFLKILRIKQ